MSGASELGSRRALLGALAGGLLTPSVALAQRLGRTDGQRALREMRLYRVPELGMKIWVENQPAWGAGLQHLQERPAFVVESPPLYHPPAVLSYASWPNERVAPAHLIVTARAAVQAAGRNFGLGVAQVRGIALRAARHGVLEGWEGRFVGWAERTELDVRLFVGAQPQRFPVALSAYTAKGKMTHLADVLGRAWENVGYEAVVQEGRPPTLAPPP